MRQFSTEPLRTADGYVNTTDLLLDRLREAPDHAAFEVRSAGGSLTAPWRTVTTAEFAEQVRAVAKGLIVAGVQPGQSVAIMSATRYEWAVADFAAWFAGAVVVPIYETSAPVQVQAVVADADVRLALAGTPEQAQILRAAFAELAREPLGVWSLDLDAVDGLAALMASGRAVSDAALESRRRSIDLDATATIVYTSGTTTAPRGAVITHRNFISQVLNVAAGYTEVVRSDGNTIIFLPLAHVLARGLQLVCLAKGMRIAHLADPSEVVPALAVLRPTFLVVVPRVLQKIQAAAAAKAADKGLGRVWASAQRTAVAWGHYLESRQAGTRTRPPLGLQVRHAIFDLVFYRRLRERLGGRIDYLLSGAAALDADLCRFFWGLGVPVVEGYGLTETTAPLTGNLPGDIRPGTVGGPLPGVTVRISEDGEVLARGVGVFSGYRNPADNAGAFLDGFFRTGDLGSLDDAGRLTILGRVKNVIVTAGGKTVSPTAWEGSVERDPLVAHAVLVGEGKPYLGGLVLLDPESLTAWASREGLPSLAALKAPVDGGLIQVEDSRILDLIGRAVQEANATLSRAEQARRFVVLLADLSEGGGIVTPTLKLKRAALTDKVRDLVDKLYREPVSPR